MNLSLKTLLILIPILLLCEGFFSGAEIALLSADKLALKKQTQQGLWGSQKALTLAAHPEQVLSTTLFITSMCVISISSLIALYFLAAQPQHSELLAVLTTSPLVVIFGELLPKTLYQRNATKIARWIAPTISLFFWIFFPITRLLSAYMTRLSRFVGPIEEMLMGKKKNSREEIRSILSYTRRETELKSSEKRMIKRIFDFKDSQTKHALIPLVRVDAVEDTTTVEETLKIFVRHRHSRMPVYSERIDNIIGILEFSDLFAATDFRQPIKNYVSSAYYVPETQALEDVIREMREEDNEMAIVVDEHGGAVGVLTFEDIVEEIVGEISDEYDTDAPPYKELSDSSWLVLARMEIQQINDQLKLNIPQGDYETLSGFLLQQFGRIPDSRDELFFTTSAGNIKFTIRKATQRQIESVLIEKTEESSTY